MVEAAIQNITNRLEQLAQRVDAMDVRVNAEHAASHGDVPIVRAKLDSVTHKEMQRDARCRRYRS